MFDVPSNDIKLITLNCTMIVDILVHEKNIFAHNMFNCESVDSVYRRLMYRATPRV